MVAARRVLDTSERDEQYGSSSERPHEAFPHHLAATSLLHHNAPMLIMGGCHLELGNGLWKETYHNQRQYNIYGGTDGMNM